MLLLLYVHSIFGYVMVTTGRHSAAIECLSERAIQVLQIN